MTSARRLTLSLLIALTALALGAVTATAQNLSNPGEFTVDIEMPGNKGGDAMEPDCDRELGPELALQGGTAKCTMRQTAKGETAVGTVANQTLVTTTGDAGFGSGTMTRTCDFDMQATMDVTFIAGGGNPRMKMNGTVTMVCSWTMSFQDAASSSLAGTMELNAKMAQNDLENQSAQGADIEMTMKVYVTAGTGLFEGYVGSGELDQQQAMSLLGGGGSSGGGPSGGGSSGGGQQGSGSLTVEQLSAICNVLAQMPGGPTTCNEQTALSACQTAAVRGQSAALDSACTAAGRAGRSTRQTAGGDPMTLKLKKAAGQVRIVSPLPKVGAKGGAAKVTAKTKVLIVATKGAKCTIRTQRGVLGTATSKDSAKRTVVRPKRGAWTGAKWIKATCKLDGKSFSSPKVRVKG